MKITQQIIIISGSTTYQVDQYTPNTNTLSVYVNGVKQIWTIDYEEINEDAIRFNPNSIPRSGIMEILRVE